MDCELALSLISSRLDREITSSDHAWLTEHLQDCAACRATAEAFSLQHQELKHAFKPRRAAVVATVDRVNAVVTKSGRRGGLRWRVLLRPAVLIPMAAALWFITAVVFYNLLAVGQRHPDIATPTPPLADPRFSRSRWPTASVSRRDRCRKQRNPGRCRKGAPRSSPAPGERAAGKPCSTARKSLSTRTRRSMSAIFTASRLERGTRLF